MTWAKEVELMKCPYYVTHNDLRKKYYPAITCHSLPGMEGGESLQIRFKGKERREEYMQARCMSCYYNCPIFKAIAEAEKQEEHEQRRKDEWKRKKD